MLKRMGMKISVELLGTATVYFVLGAILGPGFILYSKFLCLPKTGFGIVTLLYGTYIAQ